MSNRAALLGLISNKCIPSNMLKEVYVRFNERNKRIRFESQNQPDDVSRLKAAFEEASRTDQNLRTQLEGKDVFFQEEKVTKKGAVVLCDIEETVLDDECQLVAKFCRRTVLAGDTYSLISSISNNATVDINDNLQSCIDTISEASASFGCLSAVLPSEDVLDIEFQPLSGVSNVNIAHFSTSIYSNDERRERYEESGPNELEHQVYDVRPSGTADPRTRKASRSTLKKQTVHIPWKDLDPSILQLRPAYDVFHRSVVKFYSEYLSVMFGLHELNAAHYDVMGALMCQKFPELADGCISRPQTSICSDMSQFVRNKRRQEKMVLKRCELEETSRHAKVARIESGPSAEEVTCDSDFSMTHAEEERMESMAQERRSKIQLGCTTHIRFLFKASHKYRRNWISKTLPVGFSVGAITKHWPHMGKPEMILEEQALMLHRDLQSLETSLYKCLTEVAKFSELELPDEATHRQQVECLSKLYMKHKLRNASKDLPPCFTVKEAKERIGSELSSVEGEGARCVVYLDEDLIASCFVVADGNIRMKLAQPNPMKAMALLLASYRAWDKYFPKGYKSFLNIFEEYGLQMPVADISADFKRFKKSFTIWRGRQSIV